MNNMETDKIEYEANLAAFKDLLDRYTIADLKTMIYQVPDTESGGCCYPAIQTLFSLMELIGQLNYVGPETKFDEMDCFIDSFTKIGGKYNDPEIAKLCYLKFRHGIAHKSLAKTGVRVRKSTYDKDHLMDSHGCFTINVRLLFEDFLPMYKAALTSTYTPTRNYQLKKIFEALNNPQSNSIDVDILTPEYITTASGTQLNVGSTTALHYKHFNAAANASETSIDTRRIKSLNYQSNK